MYNRLLPLIKCTKGGDIMLKFKPTFYLYTNEINERIKKSIMEKFIKQIAQCVLTDITEASKQAKEVLDEGEGVVG